MCLLILQLQSGMLNVNDEDRLVIICTDVDVSDLRLTESIVLMRQCTKLWRLDVEEIVPTDYFEHCSTITGT